jgi:hypothetical protein
MGKENSTRAQGIQIISQEKVTLGYIEIDRIIISTRQRA